MILIPTGGAPVDDCHNRPTEHTIPFEAAKVLYYSFPFGEGMGISVNVYFDEAGRAVAIEQISYGWA